MRRFRKLLTCVLVSLILTGAGSISVASPSLAGLLGEYVGLDGAHMRLSPMSDGLRAEIGRDGAAVEVVFQETASTSAAPSLVGRVDGSRGAALLRLELPESLGAIDLSAPAAGLSLVWIPLAENGAPQLSAARVSVFLRPQSAAIEPGAPTVEDAVGFVDSYSLLTPDVLAARYRRLSVQVKTVIAAYPHVMTDLYKRLCSAADPLVAPSICRDVEAGFAALRKRGGTEAFASALARERRSLSLAMECAVGAAPRSRCLAASRGVARADRMLDAPIRVLKRYDAAQ